jgi:hypothetical protein
MCCRELPLPALIAALLSMRGLSQQVMLDSLPILAGTVRDGLERLWTQAVDL